MFFGKKIKKSLYIDSFVLEQNKIVTERKENHHGKKLFKLKKQDSVFQQCK